MGKAMSLPVGKSSGKSAGEGGRRNGVWVNRRENVSSLTVRAGGRGATLSVARTRGKGSIVIILQKS